MTTTSRFAISLAGVIFLASCSNEASVRLNQYGSASETVSTQYGSFRVSEHPDGDALGVSSTAYAGHAFARGLTFGIANTAPSEGAHMDAAQAYIDRHPQLRKCRITNGYLLTQPIYEFRLEC